uniref:G-protein coupled receptors family 1 profile domain-containing protein n=1 Tax=Acrobeloides nanus TaxID=290746 RepID=A0A914E329_9BILA
MFLYGLSRIVQFASTYMVVCATIERFIVVANFKALAIISTAKGRIGTILIAIVIILALRIPAFFDYKVIYESRCGPLEDYIFEPVLMNHEDYVMFNFYVISVVQILVPFILLLSLNLLIILLTKKKLYNTLGSRHALPEMPKIAKLLRRESIMNNKQHRLELRYATRTMVMIVFTYLLCNMFNVFITIMENVFKDNPLMFNEDGSSTKFYTYTADIISIMVAVNSLSRIFVYFFGNPQFRSQLIGVARTTFSRIRDCITINHFSKKLDECKPVHSFEAEKSSSSKTDDTCYL